MEGVSIVQCSQRGRGSQRSQDLFPAFCSLCDPSNTTQQLLRLSLSAWEIGFLCLYHSENLFFNFLKKFYSGLKNQKVVLLLDASLYT